MVIGTLLIRIDLIEDVGIAGETAGPIVIAEDGERVAAGDAVVVGREYAADCRLHAEDVEVVAGDQLGAAALGLALHGEARVEGRTREDAGDVGGAVAQALVHWIGEGFGVVAVAGDAAGFRSRGVEDHDFVGILYGEAAEEDLIHQRKDGGVGADAERQRDDGNGGEAGIFR